ncbi:hypothetical protein [Desulfovibrio oxyclinae]|uniref:hypothetical protein n=1 Tax=Desulfovibrio oxyclinae TaxID=63560 RepID=UPI000374F4DF|nr:hypothetical protein [Desulfovibrio oxyclinae]
MTTRPTITLGFTTFRPETLPYANIAMRDHALVLLEEPDTPGFEAMLRNELPVDEYLMLTDFEFPRYAAQQCELLKRLHSDGVRVRQVHPWMDRLAAIHEFFASGKGPDDLPESGPERDVYERERTWTRSLMDYYESSATGDFGAMIEAVRRFAAEDAEKIRDMDTVRAKAVMDASDDSPDTYVECGSIHHLMVLLMHRQLRRTGKVRVVHLMEEICRTHYGRRRLLPPGDVLTYRHLLNAPPDAEAERQLAARALAYNRLIAKEESSADVATHPHMQNEAAVIGFVKRLSFDQCREVCQRGGFPTKLAPQGGTGSTQ